MPTLPDVKHYVWDEVSAVRRAHIAEAEAAAQRLSAGQSFYDWLRIGQGLAEWRDGAAELAGSKVGTAYYTAWKAAIPLYPKLAEISKDKGERQHAIWMWENHEVIEAWHAGLSDKQRRKWNHPRTIWNHHPLGKAVARDEPHPTSPHRHQTAAARTLHEAAEALTNAKDIFDMTRAGWSAGNYDLTTPELRRESAANFIEVFGPEDVLAFIFEGLLPLLDPAQAMPLIKTYLRGAKTPVRRPAAKRRRQTQPQGERDWDAPGAGA